MPITSPPHSEPPTGGFDLQSASLLMLTQRGQAIGEVVGRVQGVGVVFAEDAASAGQGVLIQGTGPLVLAQLSQMISEVVGRNQGLGVVLAEEAASAGQ